MRDDLTPLSYDGLAAERPDLFYNPPACPIRVLLAPQERAAAEAATAARLAARGQPADWAATGVVYQDQYAVMLRDAVMFADGRLGTYMRLFERPLGAEGVAILPRVGDDFLLLRHFRHADRRFHLEIPRGFAEPDVSAEDNARRELAEEIGGDCESLIDLGDMVANSGVSGGRVRLFLANLRGYGRPQTAEGVVEILRTPPAVLAEMVADGRVSDGFTLACWARAAARRLLTR